MKVDQEVSIKNISGFYFNLREEVEKNVQIVLDFSETVRIDTSAAQVILATEKKVKELDKTIKLVGVSPDLLKLLKIAGIKLQ